MAACRAREWQCMWCSGSLHYQAHRRVGVGSMVTSGNLGDVMVRQQTEMPDVGSIPTLGAISPILIIPITLVHAQNPVQDMRLWLFNLPCVCIYVSALPVCNCKTFNSAGISVVVCTNLSNQARNHIDRWAWVGR